MPRSRPSAQALTLDDFWASIEKAWAAVDPSLPHLALATNDAQTRNTTAERIGRLLPKLCTALEAHLTTLSLNDLRAWNTYANNAVEDISLESPYHDDMDLEDILVASRADDDEYFHYTCCFAVAAGRKFYELFKADPMTFGITCMAAEDILVVPANVAMERWGRCDVLDEDA